MIAAEEPSIVLPLGGGLRRPTFLPPLYISEPVVRQHVMTPCTPSSLPSIDEDLPLVSPTSASSPFYVSFPTNSTSQQIGSNQTTTTTPTKLSISPKSPTRRPSSPIPSRPVEVTSGNSPVFSVPPSVKGRTPRSSDAIPERPFN